MTRMVVLQLENKESPNEEEENKNLPKEIYLEYLSHCVKCFVVPLGRVNIINSIIGSVGGEDAEQVPIPPD